jgi:hypothetical protein
MHAPCCHLWPAPLYNILQHCLITARLSTKVINKKCVFRFSRQLLSKTFFILGRNAQDMMKNAHWSSRRVPFILVRLNVT